ncbi:MAG: hypothetical protein ACOC56_02530 [Atribacterota bacterium]
MAIKSFTKKEGRKPLKRREKAAKGILRATGVIGGEQRYSGHGRPRGTYKYGMPIHIYKKRMAEQKALYRQYQMQQQQNLQRRGLTPEQITELQYARTQQETQVPEREIYPIQKDSRKIQAAQALNVADDEKNFKKWSAIKTVSPRTQEMLTRLRRIQNKGEVDNIEMQRRIYERRLLSDAGNLLKAKNLFGRDSATFNILEVEGNILTAPNVFKENPENNILRPRPRNILDSRENRLRFG